MHNTLSNIDQETGQKVFNLHLDMCSAVYTKKGWEVMACSKPVEQFVLEAVVKEDVANKIPSVLLATPLPDWAYSKDGWRGVNSWMLLGGWVSF